MIVLTLPRSGATCFFHWLRTGNDTFDAYDEPFNPKLWDRLDKISEAEWSDLDPPRWVVGSYHARRRWSELWDSLSPVQRSYFEAVVHRSTNRRVLLKVNTAPRLDTDEYTIGYVRDVRGWVTSHLRPLGNWTVPDLPESFFEFEGAGWRDRWGMREAAQAGGFRRSVVQNRSVAEQLVDVWNRAVTLIRERADILVTYDRFARNPDRTLHRLSERWVGKLSGDYEIHEPKPPYEPGNEKWADLIEKRVRPGNRRAALHDFHTGIFQMIS